METVVQLLVGAFALVFAAFFAFGIRFPRSRATRRRTSAVGSPQYCAGAAVFCSGIGICVLGHRVFPPSVCLALVAISLAGWAVNWIGCVVDVRSQARRAETARPIDIAGLAVRSAGRGDRPARRRGPISWNRGSGYRRGPRGATFRWEADGWRITAPLGNGGGTLILVSFLSLITLVFGIAAYQIVFRPEQVRHSATFVCGPFRFRGDLQASHLDVVLLGVTLSLLLLFCWRVLMVLGGKVVIRARGERGLVFVGIGPFGVYRFFRTTDVQRIWFDKKRPENKHGEKLVLEGARTIQLGATLSRDVRAFVLRCLKQAMLRDSQERHRDGCPVQQG